MVALAPCSWLCPCTCLCLRMCMCPCLFLVAGASGVAVDLGSIGFVGAGVSVAAHVAAVTANAALCTAPLVGVTVLALLRCWRR